MTHGKSEFDVLNLRLLEVHTEVCDLKSKVDWIAPESPPSHSDTVFAVVPLRWVNGRWWYDEGLPCPMEVPAPLCWRQHQPGIQEAPAK